MRDECLQENRTDGLMTMKNEKSMHHSNPEHSTAVETVAREIVIWAIVASAICTIMVMLVNV